MALPVFNEGTQRYHDPDTNLMMKTAVAESVLASSVPAISPAVLSPVAGGEGTMGAVELFQSMADSLKVIENGIMSLVTQSSIDARDESISDADVIPPMPDGDGRDDDPTNKEPGLLSRGFNKMGGRAGLLKAGLMAALAGVMLFSEQVTKALEPILKFTKEKIFPIALAGFELAMDGAKATIDLIISGFDKLMAAFDFLTDPEISLEVKVEAVKTAFKDFGAWLGGLFDGMATYVAEAFGMEFEEGETLGSWIGDKLEEGWATVKNWFEGIMPEWMPDFKDIGVWIVDKVSTAWQGIKDFFGGAIEAFKLGAGPDGEGGFSTLGAWLKDKLVSPINFLKDLFAFPEKPPEGYFSFEFGGKVMSKFIDIVFLPLNLAINFLKDIFGFSKDDAEKDPNYEPFSVGETIVGLYSKMWDWITDKFTFDPSELVGQVMDFGSFMKAISIASGSYLKTLLNPFTEGSNIEAAKAAYESTMSEYGFGDTAGGLITQPNPSTAALASQTAMMEASGAAVAIYDNSYTNTSTQTSQDTYTATELGTDHQESTVKPAGNKEHLRNK